MLVLQEREIRHVPVLEISNQPQGTWNITELPMHPLITSLIIISSYVVKDSKEVEWSLWPWVGAGIDRHKVVGAKRGVVDVAVGKRTMMLPAERVISRRKDNGIIIGENLLQFALIDMI